MNKWGTPRPTRRHDNERAITPRQTRRERANSRTERRPYETTGRDDETQRARRPDGRHDATETHETRRHDETPDETTNETTSETHGNAYGEREQGERGAGNGERIGTSEQQYETAPIFSTPHGRSRRNSRPSPPWNNIPRRTGAELPHLMRYTRRIQSPREPLYRTDVRYNGK